jgi:chaperonin GroES
MTTKAKEQKKYGVEPLGDRIIVKRLDTQEEIRNGIVIPGIAQEKPREGEVVAVGPGRLLDNGQTAKSSLQAGDRVLFAKYSGSEIKMDGDELLIMREDDILVRIV